MASVRTRPGFTIVEILIVVAVLAALAAILLPALGGVRRRGMKTEELNAIRQVGIAWGLYANANNDAALPGYLSELPETGSVLDAWKMRFLFPDKQPIPVREAAPWPFRLLSYLGSDPTVLLDHVDLDDPSAIQLSNYTTIIDDGNSDDESDDLSLPRLMARHCSFGYNAFYVGGWWEMADFDEGSIPRFRFSNARVLGEDGPGDRVAVTARTIATIRNPSRLVTFCSTAARLLGAPEPDVDSERGSFLAVPNVLASEVIWRPYGELAAAFGSIPQVDGRAVIPIGRYTGQATVLRGDLGTTLTSPGSLADQRDWINGATSRQFRHTP